MQKAESRTISLLFTAGVITFCLSIIWVNLHNSQWFNFDMLADATFVQKAATDDSLFPANWMFGNQFYIIATPVLSIPFYFISHNAVFSISFASILMMFLILYVFFWSFHKTINKSAMSVGLFCMSGATILGDSASSCTFGFQIIYTMASYYACYILVILLHLGIWNRYMSRIKVSNWLVVIALFSSFCLGIQSLRETLSLCIPFLFLTVLVYLRERSESAQNSLFFAIGTTAVNVIGLILNHYIASFPSILRSTNLTPIQFEWNLSSFATKIYENLSIFSEFIGFRYWDYNWKWKPLAALGLFSLLLGIIALLLCIKIKTHPLRLPIFFCWLSLLGVMAAGILVIHIRAIYFFVWLILIPLSTAFLIDVSGTKIRLLCQVAILLCGAINYIYNFYPDFCRYHEQKEFYNSIVSWLDEKAINRIYGDYQAPTISAFSGSSISYTSVFPNLSATSQKDGLLVPYGSPVALDGYLSVVPETSALILSDSPYDSFSGYRYLNEHASSAYKDLFDDCFHHVMDFQSDHINYSIYLFDQPTLFPSQYITQYLQP